MRREITFPSATVSCLSVLLSALSGLVGSGSADSALIARWRVLCRQRRRRAHPRLLIGSAAMLEPSACLDQSARGVSGPRRPTMTPPRNANLIGSHCNTWAPDLRQSSRVAGCAPLLGGVPVAPPAQIYKTLSLILTLLVTIGRLIIGRGALSEADRRINVPNVICARRRPVGGLRVARRRRPRHGRLSGPTSGSGRRQRQTQGGGLQRPVRTGHRSPYSSRAHR